MVPSVVATALEQSVNYPVTLKRGATTECAYAGIHTTSTAVIIRYDTGVSAADFARSRTSFERRGLKLGPFRPGRRGLLLATEAGHATVTTVVLRKGYLQVLVTGTGALDPIGSIAVHAGPIRRDTHRTRGTSLNTADAPAHHPSELRLGTRRTISFLGREASLFWH